MVSFHLLVADTPEVKADVRTAHQRLGKPHRRVGEGSLWDLSGGPHGCHCQWCRETRGGTL